MNDRVMLDMYVRQQSGWDSLCAGSQLHIRPCGHSVAVLSKYDDVDAYGNMGVFTVGAEPDGWVHHVQFDVTDVARQAHSDG